MIIQKDCSYCHGHGMIQGKFDEDEICPICGGVGRVLDLERMRKEQEHVANKE